MTKAEADRLRADEAAVRAKEKVYRNSGDGLNKQEKKDLEKDLNKTSKEIYRATHNDKEPGENKWRPPNPTSDRGVSPRAGPTHSRSPEAVPAPAASWESASSSEADPRRIRGYRLSAGDALA